MGRGPETMESSLLDRLIGRAKAVLLFERVWPPIVLGLAIVSIFFVLSWLGLWLVLPLWGRGVGLVVFVAALGWAASRLLRLRWPRRAEALARLDRDSKIPHRPFATSQDALANPGADPATRALWDLHRKRLQKAATGTRVAAPSPRLVERDAFALRAGVILALVAAGFVAGPDKEGRVAAAFAWRTDDSGRLGTRIDAWVDPPAYTGRPPLVLMGQGTATRQQTAEAISVPVGSTVVVRAAGPSLVDVTTDGGLRPAPVKEGAKAPPAPKPGTTGLDRHLILSGDGTLTVTQDGTTVRTVPLKAIPDLPPRIALSGVPRPNYRGSLSLAYTLEDDYGVVGAEAHFDHPVIGGKPVTGRTLVDPPKGVLSLPATPGALGDAKTTLDLSDHPWAGARVTMTLTARDEAGNTGESKPVDLVLPARPFTNPLARALVEQRRNLVLDPDNRDRVAAALDALAMAPEVFDVPLGIYLGLHTAQTTLAEAKTDPQLVAVADFLWAMALRIENGDMSQTEQDLRAAQKDLKDAMERGAPPDEIKRLTENLRRQMDKFLSEMARQQNQNRDPSQQAQGERNRTVTDKDLKSLMDRMEEAARNGDMAEAQRLLDQLNGIMNNLKTARRGGQQSQAAREMNNSMNELNRMMRDQGDVRDKTFREGNGQDLDQQGDQEAGQDQDSAQDGQQGDPGQQGQASPGQRGDGQQPSPGLGELQRRQHALSQQLQALQQRLRGLGLKDEQGFSDAQEAMKQAENALGKGQSGIGDAVGAQGRALEGLQRGMNGAGQQMAQGSGEGSGQAQAPGEGDTPSDEGDGTDPLGRPRQGRGSAQNNQLDVSGGLAARAARVMEELRRRLADPTRSQDEQDYLERLLKRY
ncbi:TIGR02302 family protein [Lichenifustis flavocetrariae]|uniref:TIGR02302 family protein n=1 Tax=Lichenifustis flavocetrariae TaxID=2949735 RepID=A0AA41Z3X6_9HYPH|nr:TIGR02302 family protein [Lichenifustis flavocetrariae]MCW6509880.1 TIGR02302 family protein [Lichenifustis flavocetrariae]